ncbi:hypothetical protein BDY19DRAFT_963774 [Irpex rosettiformis]|uniref:Uncharacterized protein n=1 Tax=Irpex rosettiformis TaxID=378272 RepID=A0ACB8TV79_9APHY|nr:hypothetical protein BDY19DRAFT_963774 [Irpex rosettiformis]
MATSNSDYPPLRYSITGNHKYRQILPLLTTNNLKWHLFAEMNSKWIGPFSPKMFMEELMPISAIDFAEYEKKQECISFSSRTGKDDKRERGLYDTFIIVREVQSEELQDSDVGTVQSLKLDEKNTVMMDLLVERHGIVPRLVCGGDVEDQGVVQKTICDGWVNKQTLPIWHASMRVHFHHLLVQRLAYPIESEMESKEMVTAFYNVFGVIEEAYDAPEKIVHRDISSGNVMIGDEATEGEVGLLGDWDHTNETIREAGYEHQKFRTGTWAFTSIAMLEDPSEPHELLDDLESMGWTLFYSALHTFKHSGVPNMKMFEYAYREKNRDGTATGRILGGEFKQAFLFQSRSKIAFDCLPLDQLLTWMFKQLKNYYVARADLHEAQQCALRFPTASNLSDLESARQTFDRIHSSLSKPSTWRERFKEALDSEGWTPADALTERQYPECTEEEDVQLFEYSSRRSKVPSGRVAHPLPETTADQLESEEESEPADLSADEDDGDDVDKEFPPIPEADRITDVSNPTPSPPVSPPQSHMPESPSSGRHSSSSEDNEPPSPTPKFRATSAKRTREDFEGPVAGPSTRSSSKRSKTELMSSMPPPSVIPLSALGPESSRFTTTRRYQSGEEGLGASVLGSIASRLRSRDKGKNVVRSNDI